MKRIVNRENGDIQFFLCRKEINLIRICLVGITSALILSIGTAGYAFSVLSTLKAENQLYQNQLKIAQEKLNKLEEKSESVDKIRKELSQMVKGTGESSANGQGGATTVPDRSVSPMSYVWQEQKMKNPGELLEAIMILDHHLDGQIRSMVSLRNNLMNYGYIPPFSLKSQNHGMPSIWPTHGSVSSPFGWRASPGNGGSSYHEGIDIAGDYNEPVRATADGEVTAAGWVSGYGYLVEVQHGDGLSTRYAHNSAVVVVPGQTVSQGDIISLMGNTGNSTGPHTHYEVRVNGTAVDPVLFLPAEDQ